MLVTGFPAAAAGTNCWVIAAGPGERCLVVDPGVGVEGMLDEVLAKHRLRPAAVLLTHGHFDHTFSVVPVCGARDVPAYIHPADRGQLSDPWSGVGLPVGTPLFGAVTFGEPDDVRELSDGQSLDIAGVRLEVSLTPGHTPGSVVFGLSTPEAPALFSGDLLFAGSVGRSDLPGGDPAALDASLRRAIGPRDDATVVYPGHGDTTTVGRERHSNPFLRAALAEGAGVGTGLDHAATDASSTHRTPRKGL